MACLGLKGLQKNLHTRQRLVAASDWETSGVCKSAMVFVMRMLVLVCVCVCVYAHVYVCVYVCLCVYACVRVRARALARGRVRYESGPQIACNSNEA